MKELKFNLLKKLGQAINSKKFKTKLDMCYFACDVADFNQEYYPNNVKNECGTSCCFLGHLPFLATTTEEKYYIEHHGGWFSLADWLLIDLSGMHNIFGFAFLFDGKWHDSKPQCAARMFYFLTKGVPDDVEDALLELRNFPVPSKKDWEKLTYESSIFNQQE